MTCVAVVLLFLAGCGSTESKEGRLLSGSEQNQIEAMADITSSDGPGMTYHSVVDALVSAGYQPMQWVSDEPGYTEGARKGVMLFARCAQGQTSQECVGSAPTVEQPHAFVGWGSFPADTGGSSISIDGVNRWVAEVNGIRLSCMPAEAFQPNKDTVTFIPRVFQAFAQPDGARTGDLEIDFSGGDTSFQQGMIRWHCDAV